MSLNIVLWLSYTMVMKGHRETRNIINTVEQHSKLTYAIGKGRLFDDYAVYFGCRIQETRY